MPMNLADLPQEGSVQLRGQLPFDQGAGASDRLDAMDIWRQPKVVRTVPDYPHPPFLSWTPAHSLTFCIRLQTHPSMFPSTTHSAGLLCQHAPLLCSSMYLSDWISSTQQL